MHLSVALPAFVFPCSDPFSSFCTLSFVISSEFHLVQSLIHISTVSILLLLIQVHALDLWWDSLGFVFIVCICCFISSSSSTFSSLCLCRLISIEFIRWYNAQHKWAVFCVSGCFLSDLVFPATFLSFWIWFFPAVVPCIVLAPFLLLFLMLNVNGSVQTFPCDSWISLLQLQFGVRCSAFCPRRADVTGQGSQWAGPCPACWELGWLSSRSPTSPAGRPPHSSCVSHSPGELLFSQFS